MTEVRIRHVDDWVIEWHKTQAKLDGKTLETELRQVLTAAALERKRAIAQEMRASLETFGASGRIFSDSAAIIREDRDRHG